MRTSRLNVCDVSPVLQLLTSQISQGEETREWLQTWGSDREAIYQHGEFNLLTSFQLISQANRTSLYSQGRREHSTENKSPSTRVSPEKKKTISTCVVKLFPNESPSAVFDLTPILQSSVVQNKSSRVWVWPRSRLNNPPSSRFFY